jgi:hypothetical protein
MHCEQLFEQTATDDLKELSNSMRSLFEMSGTTRAMKKNTTGQLPQHRELKNLHSEPSAQA